MAPSARELKILAVQNRRAWRAWLKKNHSRRQGVRLVVYKKHSGSSKLSYDDVVEEALCFGWIDSTLNVLDEVRFTLRVSPRKPHSVWAKSNKQRVRKLIRAGRMTPAGMEKIQAAKRDGSWSQLDAVDALRIPADLRAAMSAHRIAQRNFAGFSNSAKKMILWWITSAKRPETRAKRIAETVALAAMNKKVGG